MKKSYSWTKPNIPKLIGRKKVDLSTFEYAIHIPRDFIVDFVQANDGFHLERGNRIEIVLMHDGILYKAFLHNVNQQKNEGDVLQIRYDNSEELKQVLRERLNRSYSYIQEQKAIKEDSARIKIPNEIAEYVDFYDTGKPFEYRIELITAGNKEALTTTGFHQEK
ncbi:hypothetical protein [Heliorestis convoluta]|nr:hypothetical protein [Heliorestis convoluta]